MISVLLFNRFFRIAKPLSGFLFPVNGTYGERPEQGLLLQFNFLLMPMRLLFISLVHASLA
jgi:hypothetical protein